MPNHQIFQELSRRLAELVPAAESMRQDIRTKMEQILKQGFTELNLLTEEEFQSRVAGLERAQQRIAELEQQIKELEQRLRVLESGGE